MYTSTRVYLGTCVREAKVKSDPGLTMLASILKPTLQRNICPFSNTLDVCQRFIPQALVLLTGGLRK